MNSEEKYQSLHEVYKVAIGLMKLHGVDDCWYFRFDNAKSRAGMCNESKKMISLSKIFALLFTKEKVEKTILHEIAHALVGVYHGHDNVWKRKCLEIGGDGERLTNTEGIDLSAAGFSYKGVCPNGHIIYKSRKPKREGSCALCCSHFNRDYLFVWEKL